MIASPPQLGRPAAVLLCEPGSFFVLPALRRAGTVDVVALLPRDVLQAAEAARGGGSAAQEAVLRVLGPAEAEACRDLRLQTVTIHYSKLTRLVARQAEAAAGGFDCVLLLDPLLARAQVGADAKAIITPPCNSHQ